MINNLFFALCIFFEVNASKNPPSHGWEHIRSNREVEVFKKEIAGSKVVAFRGETILDATIPQIFSILLDNDHRREWVDRLEESVVLEQHGKQDYILYQQYFLPWPLKNREFIFHGTAYYDKANSNDLVLKMQSIDDHPRAPKAKGVRAFLHNSYYQLSKISDTQTKVVVEIHSDPKGSIPAWIVNLVQRSWPVKTLDGVKKQLKRLDPEKNYTLPNEIPSL